MAEVKLIKYEPKRGFAKALLTGAIARALVEVKGRSVQATANSMYGANSYGFKTKMGRNRIRGIVYTGSYHAINSNLKHNTLRKAVKK